MIKEGDSDFSFPLLSLLSLIFDKVTLPSFVLGDEYFIPILSILFIEFISFSFLFISSSIFSEVSFLSFLSPSSKEFSSSIFSSMVLFNFLLLLSLFEFYILILSLLSLLLFISLLSLLLSLILISSSSLSLFFFKKFFICSFN